VNQLILDEKAYVASVTWLELRVRLATLPGGDEVIRLYEEELAGTVDISRAVAAAAFEVRSGTPERLPLVDSLIAGAAKARDFELVHRDRHIAAIPAALLKQRSLPSK
jgi:predicted nucleic acid-binding protein